MTIRKIIEAMPALQQIACQRLSMRTLYKVSLLMQCIQPQLDFYNTQHQLLIEEFWVEENGTWTLPDDNQHKFEEALNELMEVDCKVCAAPIFIHESEAENLRLSYTDMLLLEDFVNIEFLDDIEGVTS